MLTIVLVGTAFALSSNICKSQAFNKNPTVLSAAGSEVADGGDGKAGSKTTALRVPEGANPEVMSFIAGSALTYTLTNHNILPVLVSTTVFAGNWNMALLPFLSYSHVFTTSSLPPKSWTVSTGATADVAVVSMVASWVAY